MQPGDKGRPLWDIRLIIFLVLVVVLVATSFVLFPGVSDFRWGLLVWVLVVTGLVVFLSLYRTGVRVPPLEPPPKEELAFKGELDRLAQILRRADRGMRYSQVAVALRVRRAFLTRLQAERGLSEGDLASLLSSSGVMAEAVGGPLIHAFLEDTALDEEALVRQHSPRRAPAFRFAQREGFNRGLDQVLEAMEAWP
ncbi:MAG: hypothetical protein V3U45_02085 [bacterium]